MPNIAKILKEEIQRLSRKEVNLAIASLKKSNATLKKMLYKQTQRISALEKEKKIHGQIPTKTPGKDTDNFRITGKQVRSLRGRLGISQARLAKLLGVCDNIVCIWENKPGRLQIQKSEVRKALSDLKRMKKQDVLEPAEQKKRGKVSKGKK